MSEDGPTSEQQFELKLLFLRELKEVYQGAREAQEEFLKSPSNREAVKAMGGFFHRIAGTARTAGFDVLGHTAAMAEQICKSTATTASDPAHTAQLLSSALAAVASVLDEHGSGASERLLDGQRREIGGLTVPDSLGEGRELSKVMVIDDDEFSASLIDGCLRGAGFMSSYCCNAEQALGVIEAELPDLIVMDVVMPEMDGFELCRRVRQHPAMQFTPIIFVTRKGEVEERVRGLEVGGNDYIPKPFEPQELVARVRSHLVRLAALREMAVRDGLTRCFNHKFFRIRLQQEMDRASRYRQTLALAMADIDRFKAVNDNHGHRAGDLVLAHLANVILASVRATDVVARYGGEEFAILMVQAGAEEARIVCDRVRQRIAAHEFVYAPEDDQVEGVHIPLTISIGIAEMAAAGDGPERLLSRADAALYTAKKDGRDCVRVVGSESPVRSVE